MGKGDAVARWKHGRPVFCGFGEISVDQRGCGPHGVWRAGIIIRGERATGERLMTTINQFGLSSWSVRGMLAWMQRVWRIVVLLAVWSAVGGCAKELFPEDAPRSPYERFLTLRGKAPPMNETDAFGVENPALRSRLKPLDQR
jgi:hypothetical protein